MRNRLDAVALGVEHERAVVARVVLGGAGLEGGRVAVRGVPERSRSLAELAAAWDGWTARLAGDEPGLGAKAVYLEDHMNYPYGVTAVQIEIDPRTGGHTLRRFFTSCEAGRAVNPLTTEGQIIGAAAQGIGGALFEEFRYDEDGQPQALAFRVVGFTGTGGAQPDPLFSNGFE